MPRRPNALKRKAIQQGQGGFSAGFGRFRMKVEAFSVDLLPRVGELMYESIVNGSPITGAPGQPELSGDLERSYELTFPTPDSVQVATMSSYAVPNETGIRAGGGKYVQHSSKGGRWSVSLTRRGLQNIVDVAAREVAESVA